jgi:hypothetical protein
MKKVYKENTLDTIDITCDACKWKGKGSEANIIDLYGLTKYQELHCPDCDAFLANVDPDGGASGESADPLSFQTG